MNRREFLGTLSYLIIGPSLGVPLFGARDPVLRAVEFSRKPTDAELDAIEAKTGCEWFDLVGPQRVFVLYRSQKDGVIGPAYVGYQVLR